MPYKKKDQQQKKKFISCFEWVIKTTERRGK